MLHEIKEKNYNTFSSSFFILTSPVLSLEDRCQSARGNLSYHLRDALCLPVLAGHVKRCVPVLVLQLQTGSFVQQTFHNPGQVQVRGEVQRAL